MSTNAKKQWFITTEKGTMKVPEGTMLNRAMHMAARNSISNGKTELYDDKRLTIYIFNNGKMKMGRIKVASTNSETRQSIKAQHVRGAGSPH